MTIVTKPLSDKKQDQLKKPLVNAGAQTNEINGDVESAADASYIVPRSYCYSDAGCLCLFLTALLVVGAGIVGGFCLYHHLAPTHHRLQGYFQAPQARLSHSQETFTEEFDIDMDLNREEITVPKFDNGRQGRFVHDFGLNKTGIVDIDGGRCFLMPLDRRNVLPPRSLTDLIKKIWNGYYEVDTEVINETYQVEFPPISNKKEMGFFIYQECKDMPTYRLRRVEMFKRSLLETEDFVEFAGNKMTRVRILMDGVAQYEKEHAVENN